MKSLAASLPALALAALLAGCATNPAQQVPLALAGHVDLPRFMGDWYVIASIPTVFEKDAHNARDSYRLAADGSIPTRFTYNAGSADGPEKHVESTGHVLDTRSNAVWGQEYVWPFQADYRIAYLSPDYDATVIAREKRDHVWIMARRPTMDEAQLQRLTDFVAAQGYDVTKLQRAPQDGHR